MKKDTVAAAATKKRCPRRKKVLKCKKYDKLAAKTYRTFIDPVRRHKIQKKINQIFSSPSDQYTRQHFEPALARACQHDGERYLNLTQFIFYVQSRMKAPDFASGVRSWLSDADTDTDTDTDATTDEELLLDRYFRSFEREFDSKAYQKNQKKRSLFFMESLKKITDDIVPDGHPLLQCRKCKSPASTDPMQVRGGDEPMTIFCQCTNPDCKIQWKM